MEFTVQFRIFKIVNNNLRTKLKNRRKRMTRQIMQANFALTWFREKSRSTQGFWVKVTI